MNFIVELEEKVISDQDIFSIKHYIFGKYPESSSGQRAAILANAVHCVIESHLPEFDAETKSRVRIELIRHCSGDGFTLRQDDIFRICLALDLDKEEIAVPFTAWINKKTKAAVSEQQIVDFAKLANHEAQPSSFVGIHSLLEYAAAVRQTAAATAELQGAAMPWFRKSSFVSAGLAAFLTVILLAAAMLQKPKETANRPMLPKIDLLHVNLPPAVEKLIVLPKELRYQDVDKQRLKQWLQRKQSKLAEEPYLTTIVDVSKQYGIHPLFLFAITGQEQAFVPSSLQQAKKIANNPFNVYHSWTEYNTNIKDSATIAAKTILTLSKGKPDDMHPIQWINRKYAEDQKWWQGVTAIWETMKKEIMQSPTK